MNLFLVACNVAELKDTEEDTVPRTIHQAIDSVDLTQHSTEIIHIGDSGLPYYSFYAIQPNILKSNSELLFAYNPSFHQLDVLDLRKGVYLRSIPLFDEGPYQVSDFDGFYFMGPDYLIFSSYSANQIILYDLNKEKVEKTIKFEDVKSKAFNGNQINLHSEPQLGMGIQFNSNDSLLFLPVYPWVNEKKKEFYSYPNVGIYSVKTNQITALFSYFPKIYRNGSFFPLVNKPSICSDGKTIVIGYGISNEMFVYDLNGELIAVHRNEPNSISADKQVGLKPSIADIQFQSNFLVENPFYLKTLYDPHQKIYYRFLKLPQELKRKDGKLNRRYLGKWKIEIVDNKFRKIGEKIFDGGIYNMLFSFVGSKGLYIGTYTHEIENELKLNIFKIENKYE